jgi:hypothetical protein
MAIDLTTPGALIGDPSALPSSVNYVGNVNVERVSNEVIGDAGAFLDDRGATLADNVPMLDAETPGTSIAADDNRFAMNTDRLAQDTNTGNTVTAVENARPDGAETMTAQTTFDRISQPDNLITAAQGTVDNRAIIDAESMTMDMQGAATGRNVDGSVNQMGVAVNQFASQDISRVIDTSTVSGKILAQTLGEGNYTDAKQTVQGQLQLLAEQFTDNSGNPIIPTWAAGIARSVSRIAAFKGLSGTATTAAMSQAIMEATLPIAQQDAQIFNSISMKNLDNRQQMVMNKALVLSKFEMANLDARMQAAVNNSKNFMQMDLANLSNDQQSRVINSQSRIQSILEDAKSVNAARMFSAEQTNDFNKFYDQLDANISMFNSEQKNTMERFNAGEINDMSQFNANLENVRETFYKEMQYNIDMANAKWRQSVTLQNNQNLFDAMATDVKNIVGLTSEQLNQAWDRSDALLDWTWKSSENQADRDLKVMQMQAELQLAAMKAQSEKKKGLFGAIGSVAGSIAGSMFGAGGILGAGGGGWATLASFLPFSDTQLKENITRIGTHASGLLLYRWDWNEDAERLGVSSEKNVGVLAQEALQKFPDAVKPHPMHGYLTVNYERLQ